MTIPGVPRQAQRYALKISAFLREHNIRHSFEGTSRGGHQMLFVSHGGQTRKHFFPSTPGDKRGAENNICDLKKRLQSMGWEPAAKEEKPKKEETKMKSVTIERNASKPVVKDPAQIHALFEKSEDDRKPIEVKGIVMPYAPADFVKGMKMVGDRKQLAFDRDEAAFKMREAGAKISSIDLALKRTGWVGRSPSNCIAAHRKRNGALAKDVAKAAAAKIGTHPLPKATAKPAAPSTETMAAPKPSVATEGLLIDQIMAVVKPLVEAHMGELQRKADRWDQFAALARQEIEQ